MTHIEPDTRSEARKALDEQIAAEPHLPTPPFPPGTVFRPFEEFFPPRPRPVAAMGVVENGVIRLLDPDVRFPEHTSVVVVAAGARSVAHPRQG